MISTLEPAAAQAAQPTAHSLFPALESALAEQFGVWGDSVVPPQCHLPVPQLCGFGHRPPLAVPEELFPAADKIWENLLPGLGDVAVCW